MGLIYHAALENSLIMCFMVSRSGMLPVSRREKNEVDDLKKLTSHDESRQL